MKTPTQQALTRAIEGGALFLTAVIVLAIALITSGCAVGPEPAEPAGTSGSSSESTGEPLVDEESSTSSRDSSSEDTGESSSSESTDEGTDTSESISSDTGEPWCVCDAFGPPGVFDPTTCADGSMCCDYDADGQPDAEPIRLVCFE